MNSLIGKRSYNVEETILRFNYEVLSLYMYLDIWHICPDEHDSSNVKIEEEHSPVLLSWCGRCL